MTIDSEFKMKRPSSTVAEIDTFEELTWATALRKCSQLGTVTAKEIELTLLDSTASTNRSGA
jgi:hypothetical protein